MWQLNVTLTYFECRYDIKIEIVRASSNLKKKETDLKSNDKYSS